MKACKIADKKHVCERLSKGRRPAGQPDTNRTHLYMVRADCPPPAAPTRQYMALAASHRPQSDPDSYPPLLPPGVVRPVRVPRAGRNTPYPRRDYSIHRPTATRQLNVSPSPSTRSPNEQSLACQWALMQSFVNKQPWTEQVRHAHVCRETVPQPSQIGGEVLRRFAELDTTAVYRCSAANDDQRRLFPLCPRGLTCRCVCAA
jgi:hypothetical protein